MKTKKRKISKISTNDVGTEHDLMQNKRAKKEVSDLDINDTNDSDNPPTEHYTGQRNSAGEYHGRGTLR